MSVRDCDGWVRSLQGQRLTFTGTVRINENHLVRKECAFWARHYGAEAVVEDFSHSLTLLVYGDLHPNVVADPDKGYSRKLIEVQKTHSRHQPHVHVIDSDGFADLLDEKPKPVPCRRLHASKGTIVVRRRPADHVFGGPLVGRRVSHRTATTLKTDLDKLDAGTAAHEATVQALKKHLQGRGILAQRPARGAPAFDIGWTEGKTIYVGEVKSLRGAKEDQQVRLGLGQVLDYTHQLATTAKGVKPVLILEKRPKDNRWESLTRSLGVLLTYGPSFPGLYVSPE